MSAAAVSALAAALGDRLCVDPAVLAGLRADRSGHSSSESPLALVTARSVEDVQATLRIATEHGVPVVPRGAGTGLAGGAIASAGEIVLSTLAMNRILHFSAEDRLAVVEAGIVNGDLNAALAEQGFWFAPDPASRAISTVGGNIATNAGGILCAKYGVTREAVLGLKVVLADGRVIETGRRSIKGVTGLDLTALMIGSEGTLGVIVEATVKVGPLPAGGTATLSACFPDAASAARASLAIATAGLAPAAMELLDERSVAAVDRFLGGDAGRGGRQRKGGDPYPELPYADLHDQHHGQGRPRAWLLVLFDGDDSGVQADRARKILESTGADVACTDDSIEGEALLARRRAFHPALEAMGSVLIEDVAVPRSAFPAMFAEIAAIEERHGVTIATAAHAGDGNLHPNFVYEPDGSGDVPPHVWDAAGELFQAALRLGGTLTGEHGVGILKRRWLADELGDDQLRLQEGIKALFDPQGILNPGKVF